MTRKEPDPRQDKLRNLAIRKPRLTVLTDHALSTEDAYFDSFQLTYRLGPVYDMLRHPQMKTPLAVAIYGDWGTGKTSAMRWLDYMLGEWNTHGPAKKLTVKTLWFYPWKYYTKEDVWRGLISEVILKSIDINQIDRQNLLSAGKQFGMFLGRSFLHAIAGLTLKASAPGDTAGAELDLSGLEKILEDYRSTTHPEKAYLNEFEDALQRWIESTLRKNSQRMVIFIDDLDRCMPAVSLEVLEALKLYLNIEDLVFVVGVDKHVVADLVRKHYVDCGVDERKCANYLAKMFQVEVDLSPNYRQVESFLDEQLKEIAYWGDELSDGDRKVFRSVILHLAGQNPREIKRLLNSALMSGAGFLMLQEVEEQKKSEIKFNQALQFYFIRRLTENHPAASRIWSGRADDFFRQWSEIARRFVAGDGYPRTIAVPKSYILKQKAKLEVVRRGRLEDLPEETTDTEPGFNPSEAANGRFWPILTNVEYADYLDLLDDIHFASLMAIEYPSDTAEMAVAMGREESAGIIRAEVARQLNKKPEDLTDTDYARIIELSLIRTDVDDLTELSQLTNLRQLSLDGTPISDISPLSKLAKLRILHMDGTTISDITPLSGLVSLQTLNLDGTQVYDVSPLSGLWQLHHLSLSTTLVQNILPLARLGNLQSLWLRGTRVTDISPLSGLTTLEYLGLGALSVTDEQVAELQRALPDCNINRE